MDNYMITISQDEYKKLCKLQARMEIAQEYLNNEEYIITSELVKILGLKENEVKEVDANGDII